MNINVFVASILHSHMINRKAVGGGGEAGERRSGSAHTGSALVSIMRALSLPLKNRV